jgi:hypothetical protein
MHKALIEAVSYEGVQQDCEKLSLARQLPTEASIFKRLFRMICDFWANRV